MSGSQFIITGTSRGIGEQLAYMLLEKGHDCMESREERPRD